MRNACSLLFLEGRSFDISLLDASTGTMLFFSLYIISNLLCFLRSSKVAHSMFNHATNRWGVVVSVSNISCSPSLNHLQSMDAILLVWVPYNPFWDSKPELFSDIACLRIPYQPCIVLFGNFFSGTPASNRRKLRLHLKAQCRANRGWSIQK